MNKTLIQLIKRFYRYLYGIYINWQWEKGIDNQMLNYLVEFYNLTHEWKITKTEVRLFCKLGKRLIAEMWNVLNPTTEKEVIEYYCKDPFSIFELTYFHAHPLQKKFREKIINRGYGKVLDYGGGIGDLSLQLAKKGLEVYYADLPSVNMEFAKFIFRKNNVNVKVFDVIKDKDEIWQNKYDYILCIEVIEHVLNPKELIENIVNSLNVNGTLVITGLEYPGPEPHQPMHRKIEFDVVEKLLSSGLCQTKDHRFWIKPAQDKVAK